MMNNARRIANLERALAKQMKATIDLAGLVSVLSHSLEELLEAIERHYGEEQQDNVPPSYLN